MTIRKPESNNNIGIGYVGADCIRLLDFNELVQIIHHAQVIWFAVVAPIGFSTCPDEPSRDVLHPLLILAPRGRTALERVVIVGFMRFIHKTYGESGGSVSCRRTSMHYWFH